MSVSSALFYAHKSPPCKGGCTVGAGAIQYDDPSRTLCQNGPALRAVVYVSIRRISRIVLFL